MANVRQLSAFRQLSLNCESPTIDKRRKSLKKQFSEDFEKIGAKTRDRPHPIRIAWADNNLSSPKEEGVIAKKCIKEVKKPPKLSRHSSLEKESILYSKQELAERLRQALKDRQQEKPNLNIFLAHNTNNTEDEAYETQEPEIVLREPPKIMPPLLTPSENTTKNVFQIRKSKELTYTPSKPSAIVVTPLVEKEPPQILDDESTPPSSDRSFEKQDPKAIKNVIIRPATAAAKRERFQKRNNTAFNSVVKEGARPPLVRSSSAPTKPEPTKPKFLATKRKIKSGKIRSVKTPTSEDEDSLSNEENPKSKKEMNRYVPVNGTEIVTMVSLISPAASDTEDVEVEIKPKSKTSPSKPSLGKKDERESTGKNVSLRKTVKSVSFQSSSIHAIRSFSASFPGRRGSMATALMLGNGAKNQKNQEKRATNSAAPDDDERGPKRRLVRSATDKTQKSSEDDTDSKIREEPEKDAGISVDIKTKEENGGDTKPDSPKVESGNGEGQEGKTESTEDGEPKFGSVKEKECWDMYCKMADKGLKVSYDTILRGMLTPTEYRMRRKESITPATDETITQRVD